MATAVMDQYMKMTTSKFVREALGDPIQKILETKQSCDVSASFILPIQSLEISHSPSNMLHSICLQVNAATWDNTSDAESSMRLLMQILSETVESIFNALPSFPR